MEIHLNRSILMVCALSDSTIQYVLLGPNAWLGRLKMVILGVGWDTVI